MRHVDHQQGTDLVGNLAHTLIIPVAGISRAAADDQLRTFAEGDFLHLVVIHAAGLLLDIVFRCMIEDTRTIDRRTMRKVSAVRKVESEERIPRIEDCQKDSGVGLRPGMRLDVSPFGSEEAFDAFDGDSFALVHHLATAVVAFAGITLGVLVSQATAHCLHHLVAYEIFGSNQFNAL